MPTATTTKSAMAGVKRKSAPLNNAHAKKSKKPKIDLGMKSDPKSKSKPAPVKKIVDSSDEDSEDSDSDGGVPLDYESDESEDVDEIDAEKLEDEESSSEELPKATDGLHPERAKAVIVNSKIPLSVQEAALTNSRPVIQGSSC